MSQMDILQDYGSQVQSEIYKLGFYFINKSPCVFIRLPAQPANTARPWQIERPHDSGHFTILDRRID
jgi:hypothetical protein